MEMRSRRRGATLVLSVIFLVMFSALAVGLATISAGNLQIAHNQGQAARAYACAESGLEVARFWLGRVIFPSTTLPQDYFETVLGEVQADLAANGITNVILQNNGSVPAVTLNSTVSQTFTAKMEPDATDPTVLYVYVTGVCGEATRTIGVQFNIEPYEHPIFNFGMATKGPINFVNNPTTVGVTDNWEADIYTESAGSAVAVHVGGNTNFDGDIQIASAAATVDFVGDLIIAGDHGADAIANHVTFGAPPVDFPTPDTAHFVPYATGPVLDATFDLTKGLTLTNATIPAGMNPTFDGTVTIQGILLIESPNVVNFTRNVALHGIIVGLGDLNNPGADQINVAGNFATYPYPEGAEFDGIRGEIGTSLLTPGFAASFTGNYSSIEGVIAASGLHFSGNASAVLKGSVINYSDTSTIVEGNVLMNFDRAASTKVPAGFDTHRVLDYDPTSYSVVHQ